MDANAGLVDISGSIFTINLNVSGKVGKSDKSPVNVIFNNTDKDFNLTVKTNDIFNSEKDYTFNINISSFWDIDLIFKYTNATFEDESILELTSDVFHNIRPSGEKHKDDNPTGDTFNSTFPSFSLEDNRTNPKWKGNEIQFDKPGMENHRGPKKPHLDEYYVNSLMITRYADEFDELSSFKYVLKGVHVPEPAILVLFIIGIAGLAGARRLRS